MRRLRVGIDGRAFQSPAAGVRRYVGNLVPALLALDEGVEVVGLGGDAGRLPPGVVGVPEPWHPPTNLGWTLVGLPRAAAAGRVDVIHAPAYTAPFWAGVPVVVTIHDVSYARRPEWYPYRRDRLRRAFYRRSARGAAAILTDSEFSAREIVAAYAVPRGRIAVVPLGVSSSFAPLDAGGADAPAPGVDTPFLLHVGDLHERRNLRVVVEALLAARLRGTVPPSLKLVLAGVDRGAGDALSRTAEAAGAGDVVVRLGAVGEDRLRGLYRLASALVYPSLYEGFGLPVLEAMAAGTPVIASHAASIPEVAGDAGILIEPSDVQAWTGAIAQVVDDAALRARLSADGRRRAAAFTWERTARLTLDTYRRVAAGGAGRG